MKLSRIFILAALTLSCGLYAPAQEYTFTAFGGATNKGSTDDIGDAARFNYPFGIAVDTSGNLFVSDNGNHTIRKITPEAVVTTLAGLVGFPGPADGTGTVARFHLPSGMAIDRSGNVFVADCLNHTIRRISTEGTVTTWAGIHEPADKGGGEDGPASAARFKLPRGVAVDSSDHVYVADAGNSTIRKISPAGQVTTMAGSAGVHGSANGNGSTARFNHPYGIAVDKAGNVFVADTDNHMIRKIEPSGAVTTLAGTNRIFRSSHGKERISEFFHPRGIAVDGEGNVFVADFKAIHRITPAGAVTTVAGMAHGRGAGAGGAGPFHFLCGITLDAAGTLWVTDSANHTIRKGIPSKN